ncbi:uncharacterized protein LOC131551378 [Onychostoma macrolepis]|uniref:uncharacterized protein LOC131551378 n=1 Tax=Onychostoma macrolepis TaxID=369639 RepID=UPI00272C0453|nr:uncharacterized protein LOC131551378 [Onychostoma macrolepis]
MWRVFSSSLTNTALAPAGTRRDSPDHLMPRTSTYCTNGSDRLPCPKYPRVIQSSTLVLNSETPSAGKSSLPSAAHSSPPVWAPAPELAPVSAPAPELLDMVLPPEFSAPILTPVRPPVPAPPECPPERPPEFLEGGYMPVAMVEDPPWPPDCPNPLWPPERPDGTITGLGRAFREGGELSRV